MSKIEEKEFEVAFMTEIGNSPNQYGHSIGQVLEGDWGFEALLLLPRRHAIFHHPELHWLRGRLMRELDGFRGVRANLLIQFKRSDFRSGKTSKPYKHWNAKYYEYRLDKDQQKLLEGFSRKTRSTAVIYAAPVFHLRKDLLQHKKNNAIISHTNIVHASNLGKNHKRHTFTTATNGKAFSEPEIIETVNLEQLIKTLKDNSQETSFSKNLKTLAQAVQETCQEYRYGQYLNEMSKLRFNYEQDYYPEDKESLTSLAIVSTFLEMTNTKWVVSLE